MKKSSLFIASFILLSLNTACQFNREPKASVISLENNANFDEVNDSIPVIILGSFLNATENINSKDLFKYVDNGSIFCTSNVSHYLKDYLMVDSIKITSVKEFGISSPNNILITTLDSVNYSLLAISYDSVNFFTQPKKYKLWDKGSAEFTFDNDVTKYTHTGVTALTRQTGAFLDKYGNDELVKNLLPYFHMSDIIHISNEVSLVDECNYSTMRLKFATKKEHFEVINKINTTIVELTGNHNLDFGKAAYLNSLNWYKENNISYFGGGKSPSEANKPLIKILKDSSLVAWIGFNEYCPLGECADKVLGANRYSDSKAIKLIDSLKNILNVDIIVACVQFGETDSYSPTKSQRRICKKLIDLGADVIFGSQAHQAQEIAVYNKKLIFYGLGNFLFDQVHRIGVKQAFFLECYFFNGKMIQCQPVYTFIGTNRQPNIANPAQKKMIQKAILKKHNFN
jgi:hypothetical protein